MPAGSIGPAEDVSCYACGQPLDPWLVVSGPLTERATRRGGHHNRCVGGSVEHDPVDARFVAPTSALFQRAARGRRPTAEEVARRRTRSGGYTRATLEEWGVPWPPPAGWKQALLDRES